MESSHKPAQQPVLIGALGAVAAAHPFARKLVVSRRQGEGREVLRALTASGTAWIGFEVTTPWQLAQSLVGDKLAARGLRVVDEFEQAALIDESIDAVLQGSGGRLAELAEGAGLRRSIANAVQSLRLAGIDGAALARTRFRDEDKRVQLSRILTAYERLMDRRDLTDRAGVFRLAVASLAVREVGVTDAMVYLMPGQLRRGLAGQLLSVLAEQGAQVLPSSPVFGLPTPMTLLASSKEFAAAPGTAGLAWLHDVRNAPSSRADAGLALFAASSMREELREVLRRTIGMGLGWDQIEILATDPVAYGVALDELTQRLGIPVSYAVGLPTSRTRPGRAVAKYLEWIQQDFPSDILRGMLERGDIEAAANAGPQVTGMALARRLRRMKIGRGRARYIAALSRAMRALDLPPHADDERTPEEIAEARAQERAEITGLQSILDPLLAQTPEMPGRFDDASVMVEPASLARGVLALLAVVPITTSVDQTAHDKLTSRLQRFEATATRATTLDAAISILVSKLDERVPAPHATGGAPWSSAGGHIHLTDLEQGGHTGRAATFVVGLDAVRFPGTGLQDALLVDDDRRRISEETAGSGLPTATERVEEKRYALAMLLSRLGGRVTLSYSTWDAVEGRAIPPAAELLQAYRLMTHDASADYDALHRALAPAASAVPRADSALLDSDDVWLGALTQGGVLRYGIPSVRATYRGFDAGITAGRALKGAVLTPHHGLITPRESLDPRVNESLVVSSTQMQTLGTCPHRYLLRYVMRVKKPDDPDTSVEAWLSALERGSLLHSVFERTLKAFNDNRDAIATDEFEVRAMRTLDDELDSARDRLPPPGDAIFQIEAESLREDVRAFVAMVREDGARWIDVERKFGRDGAPPIQISVGPSKIRVNGAIDRIDRLPDDSLMIVDYKTGSRHRFGGKTGNYDGGRRLQHVLYAAVAERLYDGQVSRAEFQFPSRRSENHRAVYRRPVITAGLPIVNQLLDMLKAGQLYATNDVDDCRFCDYAAVCRVRVSDYGEVKSMMAEWSREGGDPALSALRQLRSI
jgi:ATP-dependent helicase/nuclease subunit B